MKIINKTNATFFYWLFKAQFGIDIRKTIRSLRGIPRYIYGLFCFRKSYAGRFEILPCLHDWYEEGGTTKSEYFWQDLIVAKRIFKAKPEHHVDIGSRVDGFVAHVASFRVIEVFDVRAITTKIPGVTFKQADFMKPLNESMENYCDSLSCLHALEHFGLGRYNDPIDPKGFEKGLANMARLLKDGGIFYLFIPIGVERVQFNANWVFDPRTIIELAKQCSLDLSNLTSVHADGLIEQHEVNQANFSMLANYPYALGIFEFQKPLKQ